MMAALDLHTTARYSALGLIDSLAEGTVICAFAALLLRFRRQSAGTRFAIAFSALLAIAMMPFLGGLWAHRALAGAIADHPAFVVPESWALYLFWTWVGLVSLSLFWLARAVWHLHRLRQSCHRVDPAMLSIQLQEQLQSSRRKVALCTSDKVRVPTAVGLTNPAIILPAWVLEELSPSELNQVVLHELTHFRRWDDWTNLVQRIVKALFFFHPAVWWIEKKLAFEREMACDDAVLAQTENPRAYAQCLAHLAERSFLQRTVALAQAALGRVSQISQRVAQILDRNREHENPRAWKAAVSLVAGFAMVCGVGIAKAPTLVAFENSDSAPVTLAASSPSSMMGAHIKLASVREPIPQKSVLAKFNEAARPRPAIRRRAVVQHSLASKRDAKSLIHLTRMERTQSIPVAQTVFVFISTGETTSPVEVYQFQVWRFTVLKTTIDPNHHSVPPKQT